MKIKDLLLFMTFAFFAPFTHSYFLNFAFGLFTGVLAYKLSQDYGNSRK